MLWLGALQVDPGYKGHLFCPIYNLSDVPVILTVGEEIALIDFTKTTKFARFICKIYSDPPERLIIEDYDVEHLRSALVTKVVSKLDEFDIKIKSIKSRFLIFTTITFAILALIFSIIVGMFSMAGLENLFYSTIWVTVFSGFAFFVVLLSVFRIFENRVAQNFSRWSPRTIFSCVIVPVIALSIAAALTFATLNVMPTTEDQIANLQRKVETLRREVKKLNSDVRREMEYKK